MTKMPRHESKLGLLIGRASTLAFHAGGGRFERGGFGPEKMRGRAWHLAAVHIGCRVGSARAIDQPVKTYRLEDLVLAFRIMVW